MKKRNFKKNNFLSLFRVGFLPFPGSSASLITMIILFFLDMKLLKDVKMRIIILLLLVLFIFVFTTFLIKKEISSRTVDSKWIVSDEALGMIIAASPLFFLRGSFYAWILAFLIFRFFDIKKPFIIKKIDMVQTPVCVVLDDFIAGTFSASILIIVMHFI